MAPERIAVVALGANLGDRAETLGEALRRVEAAGARVLAVSSLYETAPVGCAAGVPDFLNAAAALSAPAGTTPESLLATLAETETALGRERPFPNAPRTCDLDLIFFEAETRATPALTLPHPRWRERAFVLEPLAEILEGGDARLAREPWRTLRRETLAALAAADRSGVRRAGTFRWKR